MLLWLLLLALAALAAIATLVALNAAEIVNWATSRRGYAVRAGVTYGRDPRQVLDVFTPDGAGDDAPVLVFFHGGGWSKGDKKHHVFVGQAFASGGVITVLPNYRLCPEVTFPYFVEDGASAAAWVYLNLIVGTRRRLFLAGHSAGAHIAALLALDERYLLDVGLSRDLVAGMIGLAGPYDFLPLKSEQNKTVFPESTRAASQPINFVDEDAPPVLLITADRDRTVQPGNTARLAAALREKGAAATEGVYRHIGHMGPLVALAKVLPWPNRPPVRRDMLAFIRERAWR